MLIFTVMGLAVLLIPLAAVALSGRSQAKRYRAVQPDKIPMGKATSDDLSMDPDRRRATGSGDN